MRRWFLFAALAGCYRPSAAADCAVACAGGCPDGLACNGEGLCTADPATSCAGTQPIDATAPTEDGEPLPFCYGGTKLASVCFAAPPTGTVQLTDLDTGACQGGTMHEVQPGIQACVIAADFIVLDGGEITGPVPLVLTASSITVSGATTVSAGAATCNPPDGASAPDFGSGGAGGSAQGAGGPGQPAPTVAGSTSHPRSIYSEPFPLRGGCQGGAGGETNVSTVAPGGAGGGALALLSPMIVVDAPLLAPGRGGGGGSVSYAGGGGGGSGGLIALYGATVTLSADLVAAGGGGGGGATDTSPGGGGADASSASAAAAGGSAGLSKENGGGDGSAPGLPDGRGSTSVPGGTSGGGGGGGGGAGWIVVWTTNIAVGPIATSPAITQEQP